MFAVLMSAWLLAAADPPPPRPPASAAPPAASAKKPDGSQKVCWEERPTGSHLAKTICATKDELDRAQQEAKDSLANRKTPSGKGLGPG